uniref:Uncharacterized protein n=1 Tax=Strigamia maritima TaxID=126957 RepID=T1IIW9_STRMM
MNASECQPKRIFTRIFNFVTIKKYVINISEFCITMMFLSFVAVKDKFNMLSVFIESTLNGSAAGHLELAISPEETVDSLISNFCIEKGIRYKHQFVIKNQQNVLLDSIKTIAANEIKEGDILFLTTKNEEQKIFGFNNWWILCGVACMIGLVGILVISLVYTMPGNRPANYGIVFDAGSTHTTMMLYSWNAPKDNNTGIVKQVATCPVNGSGISTFVLHPDKAGDSLKNCLDVALSHVPHKEKGDSPVFLGATGGMRLLNEINSTLANAIMASIDKTLSQTGFKYHSNHSRIITGQEEGVDHYNPMDTYGALDLGGASTQISFVSMTNQTKDIVLLKLYGVNYNVYSESFLCFGVVEFGRRHQAQLLLDALSNSTQINDPCGLRESNQTVLISHLFNLPCTLPWTRQLLLNTTITFVGTGNATECNTAVQKLLNPIECAQTNYTHCFNFVDKPQVKGKFVAFSEFYYIINYFNMTNNLTMEAFQDAITGFCSEPGLEVTDTFAINYCRTGHYIINLLNSTYKLDSWQNIIAAKTKKGIDLGWSLGFMTNATNVIPIEDVEKMLGTATFAILMVLFIAFLFIGAAFANHACRPSKTGRRCNYWCVAGLLFLIGVVGVVVVLSLYYRNASAVCTECSGRLQYGIVVDAGSSHSELSLFRWKGEKLRGTGEVIQLTDCEVEGNGISYYGDINKPEGAGESLKACISEAVRKVPDDRHSFTPIYLGATAGMRILQQARPDTAKAVFDSVSKAFEETSFKITRNNVRMVKDQEEGLYAWVAANLIQETLGQAGDKVQTSGTLDMGGASTQIAFETSERKPSASPDDHVSLRLYGHEFNVFTHSYLCFGQNEVIKRAKAQVVLNSSPTTLYTHPCLHSDYQITMKVQDLFYQTCTVPVPGNLGSLTNSSPTTLYTHPCLHSDYQITMKVQDLFYQTCTVPVPGNLGSLTNETEISFRGTGDVEQCNKILDDILNPVNCKNTGYKYCFEHDFIPETKGKFLGISSFFYASKYIKADKAATQQDYQTQAETYCKRPWSDVKAEGAKTKQKDEHLSAYCFTSLFTLKVIGGIYKLGGDRWKDVNFVKKINGVSMGWALGFMTNATNSIPTAKIGKEPKVVSSGMQTDLFIALLILFLVLILIVLILSYRAWTHRRGRALGKASDDNNVLSLSSKTGRRCNYWCLAGLLFVIGVVGLAVVLSLYFYQIGSGCTGLQYGIVVDAGSSHSELSLFRWKGEKLRGTGEVIQLVDCSVEGKGISYYGDINKPEEAGESLAACINETVRKVPDDRRSFTPIYLSATAGMRILQEAKPDMAKAVFDSVSKKFQESPFKNMPNNVGILGGREEGAYAWIAANLIQEKLGQTGEKVPTTGTLDMGGASTQIAFETTEKKPSASHEDYVSLNLYGHDFTVFTHSYLCFGQDQVIKRVKAQVILNSQQSATLPYTHPCLHKNREIKIEVRNLFYQTCTVPLPANLASLTNETMLTFAGSGNVVECNKLIDEILNPVNCNQTGYTNCFEHNFLPQTKGNFVVSQYSPTAMSSFFFAHKYLGGKRAKTQQEYKEIVDKYCQLPWADVKTEGDKTKQKDEYLDAYCFTGLFTIKLIGGIYKLGDRWNDVLFTKKINDISTGWSLGLMTNATNLIPTEKIGKKVESYGMDQVLFIALLISFLILILIVSIFSYRAWTHKRGQHSLVSDDDNLLSLCCPKSY